VRLRCHSNADIKLGKRGRGAAKGRVDVLWHARCVGDVIHLPLESPMKRAFSSCLASALCTVSLSASLSGCVFDADAIAQLGKDIGDTFVLAGCQLGQALSGYTDSVETSGGALNAKGPGATRLARGATETVIWAPSQSIQVDSEVTVSSDGVVVPSALSVGCATEQDEAFPDDPEPVAISFELSLEATEVGTDTLVLRRDGLLRDVIDFEVAEASELLVESTPAEPNPEADPTTERFSTVCATVLDEEGGALYAADSIVWRLVAGEATLFSGGLNLDAEPPTTGRCITVSTTSEGPIVVEAAFLEFAAEVEVELP
jgi:hypothetical protein